MSVDGRRITCFRKRKRKNRISLELWNFFSAFAEARAFNHNSMYSAVGSRDAEAPVAVVYSTDELGKSEKIALYISLKMKERYGTVECQQVYA